MRWYQGSIGALAILTAACNGPTPKSADAANVPIRNTAAVVENEHIVTDVPPSDSVLELLHAPDRDARDVALDGRYQAAELLTFLRVQPGDRVAELAAGGGYLSELLARATTSQGQVIVNEPPSIVNATVSNALGDRLRRPVNSGVVRVDRDLASPLPPSTRNLDLVYLALPYRTAVHLGIDTAAMDRAAFAALRPRGRFVIVDYRPRMSGPSKVDLHALHAEESANVRRQAEAAGFAFVVEARFLHDDPRSYEWNAIGAPNPTSVEEQDRFLLEFVKP
jgi:predicted methyltransferase